MTTLNLPLIQVAVIYSHKLSNPSSHPYNPSTHLRTHSHIHPPAHPCIHPCICPARNYQYFMFNSCFNRSSTNPIRHLFYYLSYHLSYHLSNPSYHSSIYIFPRRNPFIFIQSVTHSLGYLFTTLNRILPVPELYPKHMHHTCVVSLSSYRF